MPPPTTYRCTNGHEFYSYRRTLREPTGVQSKPCRWCREPFVPLWNTEVYCCDECRRRQKNQDVARARAVARRAVA